MYKVTDSLYDAILRNDIELVRTHLNITNANSIYTAHLNTPLHLAIKFCNDQIIEYIINFLIENNFELDTRNKYNTTPLYFAIRTDKNEISKKLFQHLKNIDINSTKYPDKYTLLHTAVYCDNEDITRYILEEFRGTVDINIQNENGSTALYLAAYKGNHNILTLLLKNGADTTIYNRYDTSPLEVSKYFYKPDCFEILKRYQTALVLHTVNKNSSVKLNGDLIRYIIEKCTKTDYYQDPDDVDLDAGNYHDESYDERFCYNPIGYIFNPHRQDIGIYAVNYNILRIMSGMGGLVYND
jgi:ankyrin repeat protein